MGYSKSQNVLNVRKLYRDAYKQLNKLDIPIMILDSGINELYPMTLQITDKDNGRGHYETYVTLVDEYLNHMSASDTEIHDSTIIDTVETPLSSKFLPITIKLDRKDGTLSFEMNDDFVLFIPECLGDCNAYDYD